MKLSPLQISVKFPLLHGILTEIRKAATKGKHWEFAMSRTSQKTPQRSVADLPGSTELLERLEAGRSALRARDLAEMFGVTQQHIYKLAAQGVIPSFRVGAAVRFDPGTVAEWLRRRLSPARATIPAVRVAV